MLRLVTTLRLIKMARLSTLLLALTLALLAGCRASHSATREANTRRSAIGGSDLTRTGLWDAHTHLSLYGASALDSLVTHGIVAVRDLGGDLDTSLKWRSEIAAGQRRGPRIYTAGAILDGPKADATTPRWTVRTPEDADRAVDSLARRHVDFIKTHNGLSRPAYFAVLRRARARGLRVASHLPRGVPAWEAADSGVGSIEHAAESMLASPIYAGYATTVDEAMAWWRSPSGELALQRLAAHRTLAITPTIALYAANVNRPQREEERAGRRRVLAFLVELTGRMHRAGIQLLAGGDVSTPESGIVPGASLIEELDWLERCGLTRSEAHAAASDNIARWLSTAP